MGVVYKAQDTRLDRPVALKFLPAQLLGDEEVKKRFKREAKAADALDHSNVCTVYEIDEADSKTFISMALIEGESLDKKIEQGPLKLDEALDIGQQIAKGLEAAHKKGVVHRDIKPQNIMVGEDGHVTIMDFGLAQLTQASLLTRPDQTMGTVFYMSPEQTEGSGTDHRTDIWSLGVVLYEMITGQKPFKGDYDKAVMYSILNEEPEPITAIRAGVPMEFEVVVGKCLAKDPVDRYDSASDVVKDLRSLGEKTQVRQIDDHPRRLSPKVAAFPALAIRSLNLRLYPRPQASPDVPACGWACSRPRDRLPSYERRSRGQASGAPLFLRTRFVERNHLRRRHAQGRHLAGWTLDHICLGRPKRSLAASHRRRDASQTRRNRGSKSGNVLVSG